MKYILQVPKEHIDDTLYPQVNNDIKYGLFENVIDSYYLDSQIRDDITCTKACYTHNNTNTQDQSVHIHMITYHNNLTHQLIQSSNIKYTPASPVDASLFTSDTSTQCAFNIIPSNL